jgi:hypothetical protein
MLKQLNHQLGPFQPGDFEEPGVTRYFGLGDIGGKNLVSGWAAPEANHNWNDGYEATLLIALKERPETTCRLSIEGRAYIAVGLPRQDVLLYVNGFRAGFWRLTNIERCALEAEIEPEFWLNRRGGAVAKCVFHLPDSARPIDITDIQDHRRIGFCFQSMTVQTERGLGDWG